MIVNLSSLYRHSSVHWKFKKQVQSIWEMCHIFFKKNFRKTSKAPLDYFWIFFYQLKKNFYTLFSIHFHLKCFLNKFSVIYVRDDSKRGFHLKTKKISFRKGRKSWEKEVFFQGIFLLSPTEKGVSYRLIFLFVLQPNCLLVLLCGFSHLENGIFPFFFFFIPIFKAQPHSCF